jgi:hypothetical protein
MQESENIHEPQNHGDNYNRIQDRFDRSRHRDETVHQPEQNTHHD